MSDTLITAFFLRLWLWWLFKYDFWRRKWQPISVFLPGKSHEQISLVAYSLWSRKESDTTDHSRIYDLGGAKKKDTQLDL